MTPSARLSRMSSKEIWFCPCFIICLNIRHHSRPIWQRQMENRGIGLIEPPGGKKLAGEGWEESVARELREELGIDVRVGGLFGEYRTHSPEGEFMVRMYYCEIESGEPRVMEPDKGPSFGWYSLDDLKRLCDDGTLVPNMCLAIPEFKRILSSEK